MLKVQKKIACREKSEVQLHPDAQPGGFDDRLEADQMNAKSPSTSEVVLQSPRANGTLGLGIARADMKTEKPGEVSVRSRFGGKTMSTTGSLLTVAFVAFVAWPGI